ncbi:MAG: GatB/YqeY domain-containing protein [Dictyoglomus thermophilum]|uniref:GatB/YqeY domain-containing protein n=1 Tax=Dictyoglomus thermophilum TaxID=14 RepID=A0A7C2GEL6_DICTH|nr:GatB/YqeY domain-containing protein [Dictyoglomus thermophilum]MCX7720713.1 GatB/YqeY domain-containing protein [Dictyoglomus thermophilum]TYT24151.1 GatB/YqeY domain-containing protein [Dictyoglomus thermophilum]
MLYEKITKDYMAAMKNKDSFRAEVLSTLRSAIKYREIELREKGKELDDQEVLDVIKKEIKKRKEAIEMYKQGGREDLAEKEEKELLILQEYVPQGLSEEELKEKIKSIIERVGARTLKDMGKVMKEAMAELRGLAEGEEIRRVVEELLKGE